MTETFDEIYASMMASKPGRVQAPLSKAEPAHEKMMRDYAPIRKSAEEASKYGRRIASVAMLKSASGTVARPDTVSSVNGSAERPTLQSIRKSAQSRPSAVRMTMGVDHRTLTESDWEDYNAFISSNE